MIAAFKLDPQLFPHMKIPWERALEQAVDLTNTFAQDYMSKQKFPKADNSEFDKLLLPMVRKLMLSFFAKDIAKLVRIHIVEDDEMKQLVIDWDPNKVHNVSNKRH